MVELALKGLEDRDLVELDSERKAAIDDCPSRRRHQRRRHPLRIEAALALPAHDEHWRARRLQRVVGRGTGRFGLDETFAERHLVLGEPFARLLAVRAGDGRHHHDVARLRLVRHLLAEPLRLPDAEPLHAAPDDRDDDGQR